MILLLAVSAIFLAKATNEYVLGPIGEARCYPGTAEVKSLAACKDAYLLLGIEAIEFNPKAGQNGDEDERRCALCGVGRCEPKVAGNKVAKFGSTGDEAQYICKVSECTFQSTCELDELQNEDGAEHLRHAFRPNRMVQFVVLLLQTKNVVEKKKNVFKNVVKEIAWNSKFLTIQAKKNVQKITYPFKQMRTM